MIVICFIDSILNFRSFRGAFCKKIASLLADGATLLEMSLAVIQYSSATASQSIQYVFTDDQSVLATPL
jgi:hypothetical protein